MTVNSSSIAALADREYTALVGLVVKHPKTATIVTFVIAFVAGILVRSI